MSRRFYFTNENGDNIGNDHIGNIRGAKTVAKRFANELGEEIAINDCETDDMVDFVYPDKETKIETETEAVETVEQTEIETEETAENKYIAEEYRNYFITGNERIGIVALDTHGHYCDKVFKTLEEAKRAVDEDIEYAEKKYAEQEAEAETTAVETSEQAEETKDENTHIWVTKEEYFYLRNEMRKQRGFKPLTKEQKESILIHITKNGMSNKIRLDHNSLGGGDGTKDGRWWGWNVVTLKSMLKKAGYSYKT